MKNILILASGSGTNAQKIVEYFADNEKVNISLIGCSNPDAGIIKRMHKYGIPNMVFNKAYFNSEEFIASLKNNKIDLIILAGFLWLLPKGLIAAYTDKIINIHPALLPKFGGKGMYGDNVHKAVLANKESESGITIHLVNEEYDKGRVLFQASCPVFETDSVESLASKIHKLEHMHFARVVEEYIA